jgi:MFS family permease
LTFVFVFYFQGPQGQYPITAGIELAPMAGGMVVASPIADRHGSRMLAALGMLISAIALAGMTTLGVSTPYWESAVWLALVGIGSGVFMSPNTAAMMASVPANRRGVASGARTMLQNMGAVLSISFVMAVITSAVPKDVLFSIFSGVTSGLDASQLAPFIDNMYTALRTLCVVSLIGGVVSLMRPAHVQELAG